DTGRRTTHHARIACRMLAGIMGAITLIQRASLAIRCTGRAYRLLGIGWARGACPITLLGWITLPCRGPALRACMARRVRARVACAITLIERASLAIRCTGRAYRLLGIGRARGACPITLLGWITLTCRGPALRAG